MLEYALRILTVSQQPKARTDGRPRVDLDMRERTVIPLATLSVALEEGAQRSGAFRRNIVAFPAVLVVTVDPACEGWANLGAALQLGFDPNEAHVTAGIICIAPASSLTTDRPPSLSRSPRFAICKCGKGGNITISLCFSFGLVSSIIIIGIVTLLRCSAMATSAQSNALGRRFLVPPAIGISSSFPVPLCW